jgi:hypothetical protein
VYTPQETGDDTATCLYCNVSLSGWDDDDDPLYVSSILVPPLFQLAHLTSKNDRQEHLKRVKKSGISCAFFAPRRASAQPAKAQVSRAAQPQRSRGKKDPSPEREDPSESAHGARDDPSSLTALATADPRPRSRSRSKKSELKPAPAEDDKGDDEPALERESNRRLAPPAVKAPKSLRASRSKPESRDVSPPPLQSEPSQPPPKSNAKASRATKGSRGKLPSPPEAKEPSASETEQPLPPRRKAPGKGSRSKTVIDDASDMEIETEPPRPPKPTAKSLRSKKVVPEHVAEEAVEFNPRATSTRRAPSARASTRSKKTPAVDLDEEEAAEPPHMARTTTPLPVAHIPEPKPSSRRVEEELPGSESADELAMLEAEPDPVPVLKSTKASVRKKHDEAPMARDDARDRKRVTRTAETTSAPKTGDDIAGDEPMNGKTKSGRGRKNLVEEDPAPQQSVLRKSSKARVKRNEKGTAPANLDDHATLQHKADRNKVPSPVPGAGEVDVNAEDLQEEKRPSREDTRRSDSRADHNRTQSSAVNKEDRSGDHDIRTEPNPPSKSFAYDLHPHSRQATTSKADPAAAPSKLKASHTSPVVEESESRPTSVDRHGSEVPPTTKPKSLIASRSEPMNATASTEPPQEPASIALSEPQLKRSKSRKKIAVEVVAPSRDAEHGNEAAAPLPDQPETEDVRMRSPPRDVSGPSVLAPHEGPVNGADPQVGFLSPLATEPLAKLSATTDEMLDMTVEEWIRYETKVQYEQFKSDGQKRLEAFYERAAEMRKMIDAL